MLTCKLSTKKAGFVSPASVSSLLQFCGVSVCCRKVRGRGSGANIAISLQSPRKNPIRQQSLFSHLCGCLYVHRPKFVCSEDRSASLLHFVPSLLLNSSWRAEFFPSPPTVRW